MTTTSNNYVYFYEIRHLCSMPPTSYSGPMETFWVVIEDLQGVDQWYDVIALASVRIKMERSSDRKEIDSWDELRYVMADPLTGPNITYKENRLYKGVFRR